MKNRKMNYVKTYKAWYVIPMIAIVAFLIQHTVGAIYHYHECDSSAVYLRLRVDDLTMSLAQLRNNINSTAPFPLNEIRKLVALLNQNNPLTPIKNMITLSLAMTYPPIEGLLYGMYIPQTYQAFYLYASKLTALAMAASSTLLYMSFPYKIRKENWPIVFIFLTWKINSS